MIFPVIFVESVTYLGSCYNKTRLIFVVVLQLRNQMWGAIKLVKKKMNVSFIIQVLIGKKTRAPGPNEDPSVLLVMAISTMRIN